ncbi:MAG: XdhC family protein [Tatlockia sp.]|nr:XdhC family protein [Tatlockia sp.]
MLDTYKVVSQRGEIAYLVTVVNTLGSTYCRPGARMLITQTGETIGMVSGGCLEQDILEYTRMQPDEAICVTYDSTSENEDILWGFGLGCNGVVQVLIERLQPSCNPLIIFG